jgi:hypothetical protein
MSGLVRVDQLAPAERRRLAELEAVVERGLKTFVEVGLALAEIRDRRLYQGTHSSFENYCEERWGFARNYANKLVAAAEVVAIVEPTGTTVPTSERQARELAPLRDEPEELREAWPEVVERHPNPTARNIRDVVRGKTIVAKKTTIEPDSRVAVGRRLDQLEAELEKHEPDLDRTYKRSVAEFLRRTADRLDPPPPAQLFDASRRAE